MERKSNFFLNICVKSDHLQERMAEVKNFIVKASQGLQNTVPLLMQGLMLCSGIILQTTYAILWLIHNCFPTQLS